MLLGVLWGVGLAAHVVGRSAQEGRWSLLRIAAKFLLTSDTCHQGSHPIGQCESHGIPKFRDYLLLCVHGQGQMAGMSQIGLRTAFHSYTYLKPFCSYCF